MTKPLPASTAFLRFSLLVQKFIFLQDYSIISVVYNSPICDSPRSYQRWLPLLSAIPIIPISVVCRSYERYSSFLWAILIFPMNDSLLSQERLACLIKECKSEHKKAKECRRRRKRTKVCRCPFAGFVTLPLHSGRVRCTNILSQFKFLVLCQLVTVW